MLELKENRCSEFTFDIKSLVKMHYTQEQMAKKLNITRQYMQHLLNYPEELTYERLERILQLCGYKLQLNIIKIE